MSKLVSLVSNIITKFQFPREARDLEHAFVLGVKSCLNTSSFPTQKSEVKLTKNTAVPEWQFGKLGEQLSEREVSGKQIQGMSNGSKKH